MDSFAQVRKVVASAALTIGFFVLLYVSGFTEAGAPNNRGIVDLGVRLLHLGAATAIALPALATRRDATQVGNWTVSWLATILS